MPIISIVAHDGVACLPSGACSQLSRRGEHRNGERIFISTKLVNIYPLFARLINYHTPKYSFNMALSENREMPYRARSRQGVYNILASESPETRRAVPSCRIRRRRQWKRPDGAIFCPYIGEIRLGGSIC